MADVKPPSPSAVGSPALARHFLRLDKLDEALRDPALLALLAEGREPLIGARHTASDGDGRKVEGFLLLLGAPRPADDRLDRLVTEMVGLRDDIAEARVRLVAASWWRSFSLVGVGAGALVAVIFALAWVVGQ